MELNEFLVLCRNHLWDYHSTDSVEIYEYHKSVEYRLREAVQANPQWSDLYYAFRNGEFEDDGRGHLQLDHYRGAVDKHIKNAVQKRRQSKQRSVCKRSNSSRRF